MTIARQLTFIILFISMIMAASADSTVHITYVSFVDPVLGFYKVLDETTHQPSNYVSHILTINQGDTIIWKNDADTPNTAIAIVSEQNLFPDAILNTNTDVFPYVFDQAGKYTFHVGEHTTSILTVMVRAANTPVSTENTPVPTEHVPLTFLNSDPKDTVINSSIDEQVIFSITTNQPADVTWSLNNEKVQSDQSVTTSNYIDTASVSGMSIVDVTAKTATDSISKEWKWTMGTPISTENTPIHTPVATVVANPIPATTPDKPIPATTTVVTTPVDNPIATNIDPAIKYSPIQIMGMIVIMFSIYITYKTGKDKK